MDINKNKKPLIIAGSVLLLGGIGAVTSNKKDDIPPKSEYSIVETVSSTTYPFSSNEIESSSSASSTLSSKPASSSSSASASSSNPASSSSSASASSSNPASSSSSASASSSNPASSSSSTSASIKPPIEKDKYVVNGKNGVIHISGHCFATNTGSKNQLDNPIYFDTEEEAMAFSLENFPENNEKRLCGICYK